MIRRPVPSVAQRRRRRLASVAAGTAATVVAILSLAVATGPGTGTGAGPGFEPGAGAGPRSDPSGIGRVFHAVGGPLSAVVTWHGAGGGRVELVGPGGAILASKPMGAGPATLQAVVPADAPITLVLYPTRRRGVSWQADLTGVRS